MKNFKIFSLIFFITALFVLIGGVPKAESALIVGMDFGGADLTVANGDILSGTFTNVGTFTVPVGVTVFVDPGVPLSMTANNIVIDGTLDGSGAGFAGGASLPNPGNGGGIAGSGPGGGGGGLFGPCVHGSGGGGAGYGGNGGASSQALSGPGPTPGGVAYGDAVSPSVNQGSGGGSGAQYCFVPGGSSGAGGDGAAAISLFGTIDLNGTILADGIDGSSGITSFTSNSAGGGGSGGGVLLNGVLLLDGLISAIGGNGGSGGTNSFGSGGGGGAGGRVKLFGVCILGESFQVDVSKGIGGTSWSNSVTLASDGQDGTFTNECVPIVFEISKDYRFTNVCFERDNDGDGQFSEDPENFDPFTGAPIDDDGDGLFNEDGIDCPDGTDLGTLLPIDPVSDKFLLEAVTKKNGKVSSYNPGQYYAVSKVTALFDLDTLEIWELFGDCTDPGEGDPLSALNPKMGKGGGSVVIVEVGSDGIAKQIADANSENVEITDDNDNGLPDDAHADLENVPADTMILMYVKFKPGLKGKPIPAEPDNMCDNVNEATAIIGDLEITDSADASLIVLEKD